MRKQIVLLSFFCSCINLAFAQSDVIDKIKKEGLSNSKVMDIALQLTDLTGPRLTNSPGFFRAANWAKDELTKMGLTNATLYFGGVFGKRKQQKS